jgi:hypothetical protein
MFSICRGAGVARGLPPRRSRGLPGQDFAQALLPETTYYRVGPALDLASFGVLEESIE